MQTSRRRRIRRAVSRGECTGARLPVYSILLARTRRHIAAATISARAHQIQLLSYISCARCVVAAAVADAHRSTSVGGTKLIFDSLLHHAGRALVPDYACGAQAEAATGGQQSRAPVIGQYAQTRLFVRVRACVRAAVCVLRLARPNKLCALPASARAADLQLSVARALVSRSSDDGGRVRVGRRTQMGAPARAVLAN